MQKATNVVGLAFVRSSGLRPPSLGRMEGLIATALH